MRANKCQGGTPKCAALVCRKRANALLMRQNFLEELMQEHGLAAPAASQPESDTDSEQPYFMSAPSYY
jgi:hypothetical protein